jgi:hypothetical protein
MFSRNKPEKFSGDPLVNRINQAANEFIRSSRAEREAREFPNARLNRTIMETRKKLFDKD